MIDLHVHTNNSDGTKSCAEVINLANSLGLSAIAITDHDTVRGLDEALAYAEKKKYKVIPGIEINAKYEGHNTHIIGLYIDPHSESLAKFSRELVVSRLHRNIAMIEKLQELGYDVDFDDFPEFAEGQVMTKGNFGKVLRDKGYFDTPSEAIEALMEKGKPAYVPKKSCTPMEAIDIIHQAGGLAFVAHFYQIDKHDIDEAERICRMLLDYGADGLETLYSEFTDEHRSRAQKMAEDYGCLRSGGSDYHGSVKPRIALGSGLGDLQIPEAYLEAIEDRLKSRV